MRDNKRKGKQQRNRKSRDDWKKNREEMKDNADNGRNDISWYSRNPNLLVAAGSFPYPNRPGMSLDLGNIKMNTGSVVKASYSIPGAMVLHWMPSIGVSSDATDPASVLGKEMYARVRQVYSGSIDADAPDFVMYVMALDSLFSYIAWLKRVYRCINAWSPDNYFTPDGVLSAFGFTPAEITNLRVGKTELWQSINDLVLQSHKFTVPASMDVFNRHYWMSDNIYTDAQSMNSQFYIFNLHALYHYKPLAMPSGDEAAGLEMITMPTSGTRSQPLTPKDLYAFGAKLIQDLVAWDDAYMINGYLRRAFEGDAQFVVGEIEATAILTPVYEPEVLMQIENSRAVPRGDLISDFSGFNVTQNVLTNAVLSSPTYTVTISQDGTGTFKKEMYNLNPILSIRSDSPTVADSVVASRLQASVEVSVKTGVATVLVDAGTEIPLYWATSVNAGGVWNYAPYHQTPGYYMSTTQDYASLKAAWQGLVDTLLTTAFDWCPITYMFADIYGDTPSTQWWWAMRVNCDVHNITTILKSDLANLHRICMYSEFNSFGLI